MPAHLLVAISAHGYGHAAQTLSVLSALRARQPNLRLTIASALAREFFAARLMVEFDFVARDLDVGMCMQNALDVQIEESRRAYEQAHAQWSTVVADEAHWLQSLQPDLVLANVPYRVLAAAACIGVPTLAMCSLNWADIYAAYFGRDHIHSEMLAAYASAGRFFCLTPGMPMDDLPNRQRVGVVARRGHARRAELDKQLRLAGTTRVVLVAPGGITWRLPLERWPRPSDIRWLVPAAWGVRLTGVSDFESLGWPFLDVLASVDAVVGKPGYGTFAEAACHGVPMLYVRRGDRWPEEPYLVDWAQHHARFAELPRGALEQGNIADALRALWSAPAGPVPMRDGIDAIVANIEQSLGLSGATS